MNEQLQKVLNKEKAISSSALKSAKKSTRDLVYYYEKPNERKSFFDFGNAIELYLIDKEEFKKEVAIMDETKRPFPDKNYQTKANKEWKDEFYEKNADKLIIPSTGKDSFETIIRVQTLLDKHPAADLIYGKDMLYQKPFEWICPISGLKRYARTDLYSKERRIIVDIKTYDDDTFEKSAVKNDHFMQAFDQVQGAIASGEMEGVDEYYWLAISKKEPLFVDVVKFDLDQALRVQEIYESTLHRLKDELNENVGDIVWHDAPVTRLKVPNYYK